VRFVLAIVAFVVAAAMIGVGIAQRTILAPPNDVSAAATIAGGEPFTVIDGKVLNAHPGQQTLYVSGASKQFVAYGRTADVIAWLGDSPYASVRYNATTNALTSRVVTPKSTPVPPHRPTQRDPICGSKNSAEPTPRQRA
jgi:hypothetical protein